MHLSHDWLNTPSTNLSYCLPLLNTACLPACMLPSLHSSLLFINFLLLFVEILNHSSPQQPFVTSWPLKGKFPEYLSTSKSKLGGRGTTRINVVEAGGARARWNKHSFGLPGKIINWLTLAALLASRVLYSISWFGVGNRSLTPRSVTHYRYSTSS